MGCYCGSQQTFAECCQPLLNGKQVASNCEQLMRSRYSAFCHGEANYLQQSCVPSLRNEQSPDTLQPFITQSHFTQLHIIQSSNVKSNADQGFVEFTVYFIQANILHGFREHALFERSGGQWFYAGGQLTDLPTSKIGRNDLCPCKSEKKFKACQPHQPSGYAAS